MASFGVHGEQGIKPWPTKADATYSSVLTIGTSTSYVSGTNHSSSVWALILLVYHAPKTSTTIRGSSFSTVSCGIGGGPRPIPSEPCAAANLTYASTMAFICALKPFTRRCSTSQRLRVSLRFLKKRQVRSDAAEDEQQTVSFSREAPQIHLFPSLPALHPRG